MAHRQNSEGQNVSSTVFYWLAIANIVGSNIANEHLFSTHLELSISRLDGGILLIFFMLYIFYVYKSSGILRTPVQEDRPNKHGRQAIAFIVLGSLGLYFGGQLGGRGRGWPRRRPGH